MSLNKEQLQFFFDEVMGELGWCDEIEETGVDPLAYVRDEISGLRRHIKRLEKSLEMRTAAEQMRALDGFPPSHRDEPFCECSVCMGFVSGQSSRK